MSQTQEALTMVHLSSLPAMRTAVQLRQNDSSFHFQPNEPFIIRYKTLDTASDENADSYADKSDSFCDNISPGSSDEDAVHRLVRSRERNREHARRTRLRKKIQMQAMQTRLKDLSAEHISLKQRIEECSIASILIGLSANFSNIGVNTEIGVSKTDCVMDIETCAKVASMTDSPQKEKKVLIQTFLEQKNRKNNSQDLLQMEIEDELRETERNGSKCHVNWKTGILRDSNGMQKHLTNDQLEALRRERNRMHAKMTRDRKKCFRSAIENTIHQLEEENERMRKILNQVNGITEEMHVIPGNVDSGIVPCTITPNSSPNLLPSECSEKIYLDKQNHQNCHQSDASESVYKDLRYSFVLNG